MVLFKYFNVFGKYSSSLYARDDDGESAMLSDFFHPQLHSLEQTTFFIWRIFLLSDLNQMRGQKSILRVGQKVCGNKYPGHHQDKEMSSHGYHQQSDLD